jgi:hypothetical protein
MRSLLRFGALGCAFALGTLPLAIGGGSSIAGAALSSPATVSASTWSTMPNTNNTANLTNGMASVSCVTSAWCVAVGNGDNVNTDAANIELWNGSTWSPMTSPAVPGETDIYLSGVSCVTTSFCVAVGSVDVSSAAPLIEQWNGTAWSVAQSSPLSTTPTFLSGVSCTSASFCMAVGWVGATGGSGLVEQWNGSSWTATTITAEFNNDIRVFAVSCATSSFCMFAGDTILSGSSNTVPFTDFWNGSTWTGTYPPPNLSTTTDYHLFGVSCAGTKFCTAVGETQTGAQPPVMYGQTWNGDESGDQSAWTTVAGLPAVSGGAGLDSISCFSPTSCTAVGSGVNTLATTWDGASWTLQSTPTGPSASTQSAFYGVDCLTDWACVAVGESAGSAGSLPLEASAPIARSGYRFVASDGGIFNYGSGAPFLGSAGGTKLNSPVVGMATMPAGDGYDLVAADGGVFNYGSAQFYGSMGGKPLNKPIVGIAVTPDGGGYWLVASDGGIFSFGDAQFYGSMGGKPLNKPIVGIAPTPNGNGYYEVASDGGIFTFPTVGGPPFLGSAGSLTLNKPVVGTAVESDGGYYLVASDGGIFSYPSTETFYGSTGSIKLNKPIVGMDLVSNGYYLGAADGGIFAFPTTNGPPFLGSRGGQPINAPVVAVSG